MNYRKFFKNRTKTLNIEILSEGTRNFIPKISGSFYKDKKYFSNFWEKVKLEKKYLKKEKKIVKKKYKRCK